MESKSIYPKLQANIAAIESTYLISPQGFKVGDVFNEPGDNMGSLAILGFARLHNLPLEKVLPIFGEAYDEVMANPEGDDHKNIRALIKFGVESVVFDGQGIELIPPLELIEEIWERKDNLDPAEVDYSPQDAVKSVIGKLNNGSLRAAIPVGDDWYVISSVKKAILLFFRFSPNRIIETGDVRYYDKVPTKFGQFTLNAFEAAGVRVVPNAMARLGSYVAPRTVLMPSYVNIGAYVGEGTMVDTWATVGSCAQIGKNVHLSGGVGIGGVLEPLQAVPTIIEDDCFIGARSEIVEGVIVGKGSVIGMGCFIGQSTPIVDRCTGEITYGKIPPYSVVIAGSMPIKNSGLDGLHKNCVIIIKQVDERTRAKTSINDLLRG